MKIKSKILSAAMICQAKNDVRYYLCGIHITPKLVEATNGHVLVRMKHGIKTKTDKIINIVGKIPAKAEDSKFTFSANHSYVRHFDSRGVSIGINIVDIIDGKFPNTEKVLKNIEYDNDPAVIDAEYLSLPFKMFKGKYIGVHQEFSGVNGKVKLTLNSAHHNADYGDPELYIMPVRT